MAKVIDGPHGSLNGKIGNKVYYMLNGRKVGRLVGKNSKQPTVRQLANRQGMKVTIAFVKMVDPFIKAGFAIEAAAGGMYPQNAAVGYNKRHALKGVYPEIGIDYPKVLLSKGELQGLWDASVSLSSDPERFTLLFSWTVRLEDQDWPRCNDQVMLMAYFPKVEASDNGAGLEAEVCFKLDGARRKIGQDVLELPPELEGRAMEVYLSVIADDRKSAANSQYLGRLHVYDQVALIQKTK